MLEVIRLSVIGQELTLVDENGNPTCPQKVASNLVGKMYVEVALGEGWNYDRVYAVFTSESQVESYGVLLNNGVGKVAWETMVDKGMVKVNLYANNADDDPLTERMTSFSTDIINVAQKIKVNANNSLPPTPQIWEQDVARLQTEIDGKVDEAPFDDVIRGRQNGQWVPVGGTSGQVNEVLVNGTSVVQSGVARISVPTKTSDIENDSDFATNEYVDGEISRVESEIPSLDGYATEEYVDDAILEEVSNRNEAISNYHDSTKADKSNTYTKTEVDNAITEHHDSTKQDVISDLENIRDGASKGATALQPSALNPYRTAQAQDVIDDTKVDKVEGKGLSTNDYTTTEKNKLAGLQNYDDTAVKNRLTTIEGKEAGWDAKADISDIPTQVSQLENDSDYATETYVDEEVARVEGEIPSLDGYATENYVNNHHDSTKQDVIGDLTTIRSGASLGATSIQPDDDISELNNDADYQSGTEVNAKISVHNSSNTAHPDIRNAIPEVVDNTESTATNKSLSANQGKLLNDRINNIATRGRFLSLWNAVTGMPLTNPSGYPYEYHTGDFFIVNNTGDTNYIPSGDTYTGQPSTTVYTGEMKVNDTIFYDGADWMVFDTPAGSGDIQDVYVNGTSVVSNGIAYVLVPEELSDLDDDTSHRLVTDTQIALWTNKQEAISDLSNIRTGASKGMTAVQPDDISDMATESWVEGKGYVDSSYHDSTKQDVISDLASIRTGAGLGATALQPSALNPYRTATAQDTIDNQKVDKVTGKELSTNDYTTAEKQKLQGIEEGAEANDPNTVIDASYVHTDNNYTDSEKTKLAGLQNYDDTALKGRVSAIESKEDEWDAKADIDDIPTTLAELTGDSTHRVVTDAEKTAWNGKQDALPTTTATDAGKFLRVDSTGAPAWQTVPSPVGEEY